MKRNLIELQHSQMSRTVAQLSTLISESEMVCTILAVSPPLLVEGLRCASFFNALIVHDQHWYLLRQGPIKLVHHLLPTLENAHRIFFINAFIQDLSTLPLESAADYLVNMQPCLLCQSNAEQLYALANPLQGFSPNAAQPLFQA